jgi:hypothetical protein
VDDKAIAICVDHLWRFGLRRFSAGRQGFSRDDWNRKSELRALAVYRRASIGGDGLDSRFLDGTQLRCRGQWSNTAEDQHVVDRGRSRKGMRSEDIPDVGQRRVDDVSGGHEIGTPGYSGVSSRQVRPEYLTVFAASTFAQNVRRIRKPWTRLVFAGAPFRATSGALGIFLILQ